MSKQQIILRHPSSNRRQPLLRQKPSSVSGRRIAEVAGGTAADCAAVCCCCPCGVVNLLVLAVYKVPAGICRRALRKRRRCRKTGVLPPPAPPSRDETASSMQIHPLGGGSGFVFGGGDGVRDKEVEEWEKEMWERFYGAGFWRSPSQRETPLQVQVS